MPFFKKERHFILGIMDITLHKYIEKHSLYKNLINNEPANNLELIIIIPAYNEPHLLKTLNSIKACYLPKSSVEVIILINHSQNTKLEIKQQNRKSLIELKHWIKTNTTNGLKFFVSLNDNLPQKHAGAGLARKILMDEAISRFNKTGNINGIIASLDADTLISKNYLTDLINEFQKNTKLNCAVFTFEHLIDSENDTNIKFAITLYELYLRYFKQALEFTGFPYAFYTIGSCFAVKALTYAKQGGMNRKQGGEDFYFLNKIFPLGGTSELKKISVYPSARISDRVPFGTGPAIKKIIEEGDFYTYRFEYFLYLKQFFNIKNELYKANPNAIAGVYKNLHNSIKQFVPKQEFLLKVNEINANCASDLAFERRFFQWFDAFKIIKYLNKTHQQVAKIPVLNAATDFLNSVLGVAENYKPTILLTLMRNRDLLNG